MPNGVNPHEWTNSKGKFDLNKVGENMKEHILKSIMRAKRLGNLYTDEYIQFVLVPGIALRMANTDRKMSSGKLMMRKGMRHTD